MASTTDKKNTFFGRIKNAIVGSAMEQIEIVQESAPITKNDINQAIMAMSGNYRTIGSISYDGEKNIGEIGPIKNYYNDYDALRARSWQCYYESEVAQTVLNKFNTWVIGGGLKLQAEPAKRMLKQQGVNLDVQSFCEDIEGQFELWANSKKSDYSNMSCLNLMEGEAFKNSLIGGDYLVILRWIDNAVKVQLIDGVHVRSPWYGTEYFPKNLANGNRIIHGIELSPSNEHVAYYVVKDPQEPWKFEFERIQARGSESGMLMAFMVYGSKYRIDNYRGMPLLSVVMETAKKLERYKEATVGSAEERAKIAYAIEHQAYSDGQNPMIERAVSAWDINRSMDSDIPRTDSGDILANKFKASTDKEIWNMPIGSALKALDSKAELHFRDFYEINILLFCAACQIPFEVAMSKYDSNFSASRAALKDWEHTLRVRRYTHSYQFRKPIYEFWMEMQILTNRLKAPGYMAAKISGNDIILDSYKKSRWEGAAVPHIDPLKEVNAERAKLGPLAANIPITTIEAATTALGGGDSDSNIEQFAEELKMAKKAGLNLDPVQTAPIPANGDGSRNPKKDKKKKKAP